ncbi:type IV secretory system conjugative DNA transfer family protein [Streptomyces anulatus]
MDLIELLTGGAGVGGVLLVVLVVLVVAVHGGGGKGAGGGDANARIEAAAGALGSGVARYLSGRDLTGVPRSEATWWRAGAPGPDDRRTETPVTALGTPAAHHPVRKSARGPVRAVGGSLAGPWRVLRVWHRWPRAARTAVRLAPLPVAWGLWRDPGATGVVLAVLAVLAVAAAMSGPSGLRWWTVAPVWSDGQVYGPGIWEAVRQVLRLEETEQRSRWLAVPDDMADGSARIVLRLPVRWVGGPEGVAAVERIVDARAPGEWNPKWVRTDREHYVQWTRKPAPKKRPVLPDFVPWKSTGDPYTLFFGKAIEGDEIVDAVIRTETATPHWGVAGDTGSGKSTALYIPVVHGRQNGELIDILDTKRNSLRQAEGASGVRIHKTVRECIGAFGEFLTSMMAAEAAMEKGADPALKAQLISRTLVIDELPTLFKLAYCWWRYGIRGKGPPPFADWLGIILLQGRSSNHRVVIGTQQFANAFFGGTMERAQIGTRINVGQTDRVSWGVAFGQSTPMLGYPTDIKGRGAFADKQKAPDADYLWVREVQPCYITPDVPELLAACPPAPAWFDAGDIAPWITPEVLVEVDLTAAVVHFLPGGQFGPEPREPAMRAEGAGGTGCSPSSGPIAAGGVAAGVAGGVAAAGGKGGDVQEDVELPEVYSLAEAHAAGILPWKPVTMRSYLKRGEERGIARPEGVTDGQTSYYSEAELTSWLAAWKAWQVKDKAISKTPGK